jgi:hypothetical protein
MFGLDALGFQAKVKPLAVDTTVAPFGVFFLFFLFFLG